MTTVESSIDTDTDPDVASPAASSGRGDEATLRDGTRVRVRPIHPEDVELERRFIESLSPESRRFRFLETMVSPGAALLKRMTVIDPATDAAHVALLGTGDEVQEIGVARFSALPDGHDCEFAVTVADAWQHKGLGTLLMQRLIDVARARGIKSMHSSDSRANDRMREFAEHLHFQRRGDPDDATLVRYSVHLDAPGTVRGSA